MSKQTLFLFLSMGLFLSCSSDPLSHIPKRLQRGFSKEQGPQIPDSVQLNRYVGDSLKITLNSSSQLYMQFKEGQESKYDLDIRSVLIPGIRIGKVTFISEAESIKKESQFYFNSKTQKGAFSWKPPYNFTKKDLKRTTFATLKVPIILNGKESFHIEKEVVIYVEKTFRHPRLVDFSFNGEMTSFETEEPFIVYLNPAGSSISDGQSTYFSLKRVRLEIRAEDKNNIQEPLLEFQQFQDETLFSGLMQKEVRPIFKDGLWSWAFPLESDLFQKSDSRANSLFRKTSVVANINSMGYRSFSKILHFYISPVIQPQYKVISSESKTHQDIVEVDEDNGVKTAKLEKSTLSVKNTVRIRYTLPFDFLGSYKDHFQIPREKYRYEVPTDLAEELSPEDFLIEKQHEAFKEIFSWNAWVQTDGTGTILDEPPTTSEDIDESKAKMIRSDCGKYAAPLNPKHVSYSQFECECEEAFTLVRAEDGGLHLDKLCSFGVDFSITPRLTKGGRSSVRAYQFESRLRFAHRDVIGKFFSVGQYQAQRIKRSKSKKEELEQESEPQIYDSLQKSHHIQLHTEESGRSQHRFYFFYDLEEPTMECHFSSEEEQSDFFVICEVVYIVPYMAHHISDSGGKQLFDIHLQVNDKSKNQYSCDQTNSFGNKISRICRFKEGDLSITTSLKPHQPYVFNIKSNELGEVLSSDEFEFSLGQQKISVQRSDKERD